MPRSRLAPALGGLALCSILVAGCGQGGPPSQGEARDDVHDQLVDQGLESEPAAEVADCIASGLYEGDEFTKDERDEVVQATDGDPPDPDLVQKVEALEDRCAEEAGVEIPRADGESQTAADESTTSTTG